MFISPSSLCSLFRFVTIYRGPSHTYKVQRLTESSSYSFRIQAISDAGEGPFSDTHTFCTTKSIPPALKGKPKRRKCLCAQKHISHKEVLSSSLAIHQLPFQIVQLCRRDISGELSDILKRTVLYLGKSNFKYLQGSDHVKMSYQSTSVSSISHMMAEQRKHTSARVSMHTVMFATSTWIKSSFTHATNASVFGF